MQGSGCGVLVQASGCREGALLEEVVRARVTAAAVAVQNTALRSELHRLTGTEFR